MQNALSSLAPRSEAAVARSAPLIAGQSFAECYQLRRPLEKNSPATAWLAFDEVLGKEVSLYFIPSELRGDTGVMDQVRQEIKRNRQLIHPNILRIYDLIEDDDWVAISMDSLTGESLAGLRQKKAGGFFEVAEVKPWLLQLCQTLDEAHKIQLIHGDLSPENLFLEKDGRLLIANFGTSRCIRDACWRAEPESPEEQPVKQSSPQMLDGQAPSASDDIYQVGILLHELLVGQAPFAGNDVIEKIQKSPPPAMLERRSQRKKGGGPIPPNWEKVVAACLQKQPDQRPNNLSEVITRLGLEKPVGGFVAAREATEMDASPSQKVEATVKEAKPAANGEGAARRVVRTVAMSAAQRGERPAPAKVPLVREFTAKPAEKKERAPTPMAGECEAPSQERAPTKAVASESGSSASPSESEKMDAAKAIPDHYPTLNPKRSRFPITGSLAAALLIVLCLYVVFSDHFGNSREIQDAELIIPDQTSKLDIGPTVVANPFSETVLAGGHVATNLPPHVQTLDSQDAADLPSPEVIATSGQPEIEPVLMVAAKAKSQREKAATPSPVAPGAKSTKSAVESSPSSFAAKATAVEAAKKAAEDAEKNHQDMLTKKQEAEAVVSEAKKTLDDKTAAVAPILKAAEEMTTLKAKREEEMQAANLAAEEAKKVAEEKVLLADEAKKAVANVEKDSKERFAARLKVEAELKQLQETVAEKERLATEAQKTVEAALEKRQQQRLAVQQSEEQLARAKAAAEEAEKMAIARRKEQEEKRATIMKEIEDAKRQFEERMKALEAALQAPEGGVSSPSAKAPADATPAPTKKSESAKPPAKAEPEKQGPTPSKPSAGDGPKSTASEPTMLAKAEPPKASHESSTDASPAGSAEMTNSLGMKFVPVGDVQFSVWPTRVSDFEAFASATGLKSTVWREPGFRQNPDHPVVNVTWMEATAFCKWLTFKEQREGTLPPNKIYRLPTDLEWSKAVGLPEEGGRTPKARDMGVLDVYPWGTQWPPPPGAGNYTGEETGSEVAIRGYNDGFPWTAPVGSFQPNKYGLYDMGGNVWQWVNDVWSSDSKSKVLRGASWYNGAIKLSLLSSCRVAAAQESSTDNYGFRCVVATESSNSSKR